MSVLAKLTSTVHCKSQLLAYVTKYSTAISVQSSFLSSRISFLIPRACAGPFRCRMESVKNVHIGGSR